MQVKSIVSNQMLLDLVEPLSKLGITLDEINMMNAYPHHLAYVYFANSNDQCILTVRICHVNEYEAFKNSKFEEIFSFKFTSLITDLAFQKSKRITDSFVEYDVDSYGKFKIDNQIYCWVYTQLVEWNHGLIFSGWLFDGEIEFTQYRFGIDNGGYLSAHCHDWVKPLTPKKIRFFKKGN